jgi:hypothetical protein
MNFEAWLKKHANRYQIRIINGHCKNPKNNLNQLRGHGSKQNIKEGYFSSKNKTFNDWLKSQGFNSYQRGIINTCGKEKLYIYNIDLILVKKSEITESIIYLIHTFKQSNFVQSNNKYYLYGSAAYNKVDIGMGEEGYFLYGFQTYLEFEMYLDKIYDIMRNNRYDIRSFQFFIGYYKDKRIIRLEEIDK